MLWIDEPRLEHERVRDHRVVLGVGVLLDVEVPLDRALGVGEERPLGADRRAELLDRVMVVGRDRGDLGVGHGDLRVERGELQMLLVLLRAVVAAREREDQRVVALQLAELARRVRVVGQLVVGKRAAGHDVGTHRRDSFGGCRSEQVFPHRSLPEGVTRPARSLGISACPLMQIAGARSCARPSRRSLRSTTACDRPTPTSSSSTLRW